MCSQCDSQVDVGNAWMLSISQSSVCKVTRCPPYMNARLCNLIAIEKITQWQACKCMISTIPYDECRVISYMWWSDFELNDINHIEMIGNIIGNLYVHRVIRKIEVSEFEIMRFYCNSQYRSLLCHKSIHNIHDKENRST